MKHFTMMVALICVLSVSTLAGDIPSGGIAPPPPPDGHMTVTGDIPSVGSAVTVSDVLNLLQTMFSLM